ncbi:RICIN domain-containing protein [Kitasatospora sp. NPDC088351]|uniref:RICIN domain-containing protein n=1 Tax=Kitasatospora sp. NPDC088351 TaxID=3155180 RepID=UPI00342532A6
MHQLPLPALAAHCSTAAKQSITTETPAAQTPANGSSSQQWLARGDRSVYNPVSRLCVDDPNTDTTSGTQLILNTCNDTPAQSWTIASRPRIRS